MSLTIKPVISHNGDQHLIYDEAVSDSILPQWLDSEYWQKTANLQAAHLGRGRAWFISSGGQEFVLRHYCRGGLIAHLSRDRYIWQGLDKTRAWREWRLLALLQDYSLPAPQPVAARVNQMGLLYSADLLTVKIKHSQTLSETLQKQILDDAVWTQIGSTIRQFHDKNIYHADLNAHNILLAESKYVYLIDFDKGIVKSGKAWKNSNLSRLRRSLNKLSSLNKLNPLDKSGGQPLSFNFSEDNWQGLLAGYHQGLT